MSPLAGTDFNSEVYHLRLLLCNRTDVTGFAEIKTVEGHIHPTLKSACAALNLVENEEEMSLLMDNLVLEQFPSTMRKTFAMLLANVNPINPRGLWDNYRRNLSKDYLHEIEDDDDLAYQLALRDIEEILREFGKTLSDYLLPELDDNVLGRRNFEPDQGDVILNPAEADNVIRGLNIDQRRFFGDVMGAVSHENGKKFFFLTGAGGTGKTFTYNALIDYLRSRGRKAVDAAYTGVAANLLKGTLTSHRAFGLPFEDEGLGLHVLDRFLRDVMRKEEPFGSKIIILGGDFHQILPVVPGGSRADIVDAEVTSSSLWPLFEKYTLTINQRALEDLEYAEWLLKVGDGTANENDSTRIHLKKDMVVDGIHKLINHCFGKDIDKEDAHDAAILCQTNDSASFEIRLCFKMVSASHSKDELADFLRTFPQIKEDTITALQ
ncbi:hypothetical protein FOCC_FOCC013957, partial [Frankliniella occidentalis]